MEAVTNKRLHPLLTVAAVSVIVFSAVGIAALMGVLPHSISSSKEAAPAALVAAPDIAASGAVPGIAETPADEVGPMPPAAPAATPKPAKKHVARASAPRPAPAVPSQDFGEAPRAQAPGEAPKPAAILGVVESVREISRPAEKSNGVGPIAGGITGAVVGNQFGHGTTRSVLTILGAAGGALAGKEIEQNVRSTKHWEITVRLDDGSYRTMTSDVAPFWHGGERVRVVDGRLQPA